MYEQKLSLNMRNVISACLDYIIEYADRLPPVETLGQLNHIYHFTSVQTNEINYLNGVPVPYSLVIMINESHAKTSRELGNRIFYSLGIGADEVRELISELLSDVCATHTAFNSDSGIPTRGN